MLHKHKTIETYNASASEYAKKAPQRHTQIEKFVELLKPPAKILDIGCGPGRDAKLFTEKGYEVVGIDFSESMIELAKEIAPDASFHMMDIEKLDFPAQSFDGAWASASLLHIQKKQIPAVLATIHRLLVENGFFYLLLKKGTGEGMEKDHRYDGMEKYWSFFQEEELESYLNQAGFQIVDFFLTDICCSYDTHTCMHVFCRKV